MKMQIPPINSMSKASTVAKIGRPMKKLTMVASYLAFSRSAPAIAGRARLWDRELLFFDSGSAFFGSGSAFLRRRLGRSSAGDRFREVERPCW